MKKEVGNIWTNVAGKPRGFSFVKGQLLTYTYQVPICTSVSGMHQWNAVEIDRIYIKVKHESNVYGPCINNEKTNDYIREEIGHDIKFSYEENGFMRDGRVFPFVISIDIHKDNEENYKHNRVVKTRKEKIHKLKNKING